MARIIFPEAFEAQRTLLANVRVKHISDPAILQQLLTQKSINLDVDLNNSNLAEQHEVSKNLLEKQAENYVQMRDLKFAPVFEHVRGCFQFLKSFYKPNVRTLGEWGATVDNRDAIKYPAPFADRVTLFKNMRTKNNSFAPPPGSSSASPSVASPVPASPLTPFLLEHSINLDVDLNNVTTAEENETRAQTTRRTSEEETQARDLLMNPIIKHLKDIADYLFKLYKGEERKMGEWGFTIDDSKRKPSVRTTTLKPSAQITVNGVVIGGTFTNISGVDLHLYKGKNTTGTPSIIPPGGQKGMVKGFSIITVVNPSTLQSAKYTVLVVN